MFKLGKSVKVSEKKVFFNPNSLFKRRNDTDEIDDETTIRAAARDMVEEGFTVGREEAVVGESIGAEIEVAGVSEGITAAEDGRVT